MLAVVEIQYIRQEANLKGRSYAEIARRMNIDPRTVKKYAEMEDFTPVKKKQRGIKAREKLFQSSLRAFLYDCKTGALLVTLLLN